MTKQAIAPVTIAVALPAKLEHVAHVMAGALHECASLSVTLGELTVDAGKLIKKNADLITPFVDAVKQLCAATDVSEASIKVYLSQVRGVLRGMVAGYVPKAGASIKAMYAEVPKGTGRQSKGTGPRLPKTGETPAGGADDGDDADDAPAAPKAPSKADARKAAITALFGHYDDSLAAAVDWLTANESAMIRYVQANVAAQVAEAAKGKGATPLRKAA